MSTGHDTRVGVQAVRRALTCTGRAFLMSLLAGGSWIGLCADPPRSSKNPADLAGYDALITPEDREHWAFQPVKSPKVPRVKNPAWARNPIDRFVLARQEEQGLIPAPAAEPRALVRRLYLDLTGLPPTPDECAAFLADVFAVAGCGRKSGRQPARPPRLRRTLGAALARPGPVRRVQRLRARRRQAVRLAISRLRHPGLQQPTSRSIASCSSKSPATSCPKAIIRPRT